MPTTTNFGLYKPANGEVGWGANVDTNFDTIDAVLSGQGASVGGKTVNIPLVGTFQVGSGTTGTNVTGIGRAPRSANLTECVVTVTKADASTPLTFTISKNGVSLFSAPVTVAAGTESGTEITAAGFLGPVTVAKGDKFTLDITSGSTDWSFSAQLE